MNMPAHGFETRRARGMAGSSTLQRATYEKTHYIPPLCLWVCLLTSTSLLLLYPSIPSGLYGAITIMEKVIPHVLCIKMEKHSESGQVVGEEQRHGALPVFLPSLQQLICLYVSSPLPPIPFLTEQAIHVFLVSGLGY